MKDIGSLDKDGLVEYALDNFGVLIEIGKKSLKALQDEVQGLVDGKDKPVEEVKESPEATHLLNRETGYWFPYSELLKNHLTNAVPCDENGKPV